MRSLLALTAAAALALAGCGGGGKSSGGTTTSAAPTSKACTDVPPPQYRKETRRPAPKVRLDPAKTYTVDVQTNCGDFTITLDPKASPKAAAAFYELARTGFFDKVVFHRIVPSFVVQGGDPTGTGTGGPGFKTIDKPARNTRYTQGVVAMAKSAADPPGTAGSQFFIVTPKRIQLPPDYAVIGRVTKGLDVVLRIGNLGDPSGVPLTRVEIGHTVAKTS